MYIYIYITLFIIYIYDVIYNMYIYIYMCKRIKIIEIGIISSEKGQSFNGWKFGYVWSRCNSFPHKWKKSPIHADLKSVWTVFKVFMFSALSHALKSRNDVSAAWPQVSVTSVLLRFNSTYFRPGKTMTCLTCLTCCSRGKKRKKS